MLNFLGGDTRVLLLSPNEPTTAQRKEAKRMVKREALEVDARLASMVTAATGQAERRSQLSRHAA